MRRSVWELAVALAAVPLMARWLPLPAADPFRSTLLLLPAVVAGLRAIERRGAALGGRRLGRRSRRLDGVVLGALVLLVFARQSLGLAAADPLLAAAFVVLLWQRLARLLVALRPCLGRRLPGRPPALFFWLPCVAYLAILPWSAEHRPPDGDETYYLLLTHSLVEDHDTDLADEYRDEVWRRFVSRRVAPQPGDPVGPDGEVYSRHGVLLPLVLVPGYAVAGKWGAAATMCVLSAALAWQLLRLAGRYAAPHPTGALLAYGLFAFAPPLVIYSYQVWVEVPAALLLGIALERLDALPRDDRWPLPRLLAGVAPAALLPVLKLRLGLVALPLLALAAWRAPRAAFRTLVAAAGALAAAAVVLLIYNQWWFGNPLRMHSLDELELLRHAPLEFARGGLGMFYDAAFGLFGAAPAWMLLIPALAWLAWRRHRLLADLAVVSLPYLVTLAPRTEWYGGWSPPFRYPLVLLPLLALALVPLLAERHRPGVQALGAGLATVTLALTVVWVVTPGWTYHRANGQTHVLDTLERRLGADLTRLFPSAVRPRTATWVWPPVSLLLIPAVLWPRRRRRDAAAWGVAAVLAATAAVPVAAGSLPTRVIEPEDAWVRKSGGEPYPPPWTMERVRYHGGWKLAPGTQLTAPLVAGGEQVTLHLHLTPTAGGATPVTLALAAGDTPLASWRAGTAARRQSVVLGPFPWPRGAALVVRADAASDQPRQARPVIVDRIDLDWR